jgi:hypothetical protein
MTGKSSTHIRPRSMDHQRRMNSPHTQSEMHNVTPAAVSFTATGTPELGKRISVKEIAIEETIH